MQIINNSAKCNILIKELKSEVSDLICEKIEERSRLEINKYAESKFKLKSLLQRKKFWK